MTYSVTPAMRQYEAEQAEARAAIYRLAAVSLAYPLPETQQALEEGRLQAALSQALCTLGGQAWPQLEVSDSLAQLEVSYMATFVHGRRGKPCVPLVSSAYSELIGGLTPGAYMLNVQAFYSHFGLTAAVGDEGHKDEPDHIVAMLEFCALLCHLECQALAGERDVTPYRRAQRDFLARYLTPFLHMLRASYAKERHHGLDANLAYLIDLLPQWSQAQQSALEAQVGLSVKQTSDSTATISTHQSMWN